MSAARCALLDHKRHELTVLAPSSASATVSQTLTGAMVLQQQCESKA
jgi:hypothetical protein